MGLFGLVCHRPKRKKLTKTCKNSEASTTDRGTDLWRRTLPDWLNFQTKMLTYPQPQKSCSDANENVCLPPHLSLLFGATVAQALVTFGQ
jgi:hypothetical protein